MKSKNKTKSKKTTKTPKASSVSVRRRMQATRQRDTPCEIDLRSALRKLGLHYRVDWQLPGTRRRADVAFPRLKVAVMVDGCFWHACPVHATWPKKNALWWREKILANQKRDRDTDSQLEAQGWRVLRFWEHERPSNAARKVLAAVTTRRGRRKVRNTPGRRKRMSTTEPDYNLGALASA
jgi:DNA mismatch endonuclease (patch repair protein)